MIFYEEQLWGTASAITVDICQTNDWNKNKIVASVTASNWEIISKNIYHKIKKTFKKLLISLQILICKL